MNVEINNKRWRIRFVCQAVMSILFIGPLDVIAEHKELVFQEAILIKKMYFVGTIGKRLIGANLTFQKNRISGFYHDKNDNDSSSAIGRLEGVVDGTKVKIVDTWSDKGKESYFLGTFNEITLSGTWINPHSKKREIVQLTSDTHPEAPPLFILTDAHQTDSNKSSLRITQLKIFNAKTHQELQSIINIELGEIAKKNEITVEDMNFDGYPDIRLLADVVGANEVYLYWLYNPRVRKFEKNRQLEDIAINPEFDPIRKAVVSSGSSGTGRFGETYLYRGGKYFLTERSEVFWDEKEEQHLIVTHYKEKNGEPVEVSREVDPDVAKTTK